MKFLSATLGNEWATCVAPEGSDDVARAQAQNYRQKLDQLLTEVLLSENLVVLAGLGTTLCLNKPGGPRIPPGMSDLLEKASPKASVNFYKLKAKVSYSTP